MEWHSLLSRSGKVPVTNNALHYSLKDQDQLLIFVTNEEISDFYFVLIGISS
jgi:hypothetical protein